MPRLILVFVVITILGLQALTTGPLFADDLEPLPDAESATYPQYELQFIEAKPGKLEQVHAWFREHQDDVLARHGATNLAYLVPIGENPDRKIVALYRYPSTRALLRFSRGVKADPLWKPFDMATDGVNTELLVDRFDFVHLHKTTFSPELKVTKSQPPRVFELRTYTCPSSDHLARLHARFEDHTMGLFEKHGMENLIYFSPQTLEDSDVKLIYLLAHKSVEAAKESFAAFRKDPDWLAAKKNSEERAGGSLTNPENGVLSEFFVATDYSPLK